jgi:hypothetical protein
MITDNPQTSEKIAKKYNDVISLFNKKTKEIKYIPGDNYKVPEFDEDMFLNLPTKSLSARNNIDMQFESQRDTNRIDISQLKNNSNLLPTVNGK